MSHRRARNTEIQSLNIIVKFLFAHKLTKKIKAIELFLQLLFKKKSKIKMFLKQKVKFSHEIPIFIDKENIYTLHQCFS